MVFALRVEAVSHQPIISAVGPVRQDIDSLSTVSHSVRSGQKIEISGSLLVFLGGDLLWGSSLFPLSFFR